MDAFVEYVNGWDELCAAIADLESKLKPLKAIEMQQRKAIVDSISKATELKEGVNTFPLSDGRSLKVSYKIDRKIEESEIGTAREEYNKLNDRPVVFDEILRIKYELSKREYDKLSDPAKKIVSRMLIAKPAAPTLEIV